MTGSEGGAGEQPAAGVALRAARPVRGETAAGPTTMDSVAIEEPLEIRIDGESIAVTMRTPGEDRRLAVGFLFAEGVIDSAGDLLRITHCGRPGEEGYGNVLEVQPRPDLLVSIDRHLEMRRWTTNSACGVCGRATIDDLLARCRPVKRDGPVDPEWIRRCVGRLQELQPRFARTGGLHAAAAFDWHGKVLAAHEDVGRHNAVDKVIGSLLLDRAVGAERDRSTPAPVLLAVSGRTSFEIVQKAAVAGIPVVAGISASSSLAIDLARALGMTLAGFVRESGFNLYSDGRPEAGELLHAALDPGVAPA